MLWCRELFENAILITYEKTMQKQSIKRLHAARLGSLRRVKLGLVIKGKKGNLTTEIIRKSIGSLQ